MCENNSHGLFKTIQIISTVVEKREENEMFLQMSQNEKRRSLCMAIGMCFFFVIGLMLLMQGVFASTVDSSSASTMITSIVKVLSTICTVVGIIMGIVGLVKFIMAHANEQGPEQQKAIMWIAVAIILVIIPNVLSATATSWTSLIK